jgi:hypothetical protein
VVTGATAEDAGFAAALAEAGALTDAGVEAEAAGLLAALPLAAVGALALAAPALGTGAEVAAPPQLAQTRDRPAANPRTAVRPFIRNLRPMSNMRLFSL